MMSASPQRFLPTMRRASSPAKRSTSTADITLLTSTSRWRFRSYPPAIATPALGPNQDSSSNIGNSAFENLEPQAAERFAIAKCDSPRARNGNHCRILKLRQRSRDCFDRQTKEVSYILAGHRQLDFVAGWRARGHVQEEPRHTFLCRLDQQHDVILSALQLRRGDGPEHTREVQIAAGLSDDCAAFDHKDKTIGDGLGRES